MLRVPLACPVLLGLLASPGPVASPVLSVLLELLVPEDLLVSLVQLVPKEKVVTRVSLVLPGPRVLLAPVVKKEREAPVVKLALLAPPDLLGCEEVLVLVVFLEVMAELVSWVLLALVGQAVLLVCEVPVEILVVLGSLVSWDPGVFLVPLEMLAQLVKKVPWASLASTAGLGQSALLEQEESLATLDFLAPKAPLVILAKVVRKVMLALLVLGVLQVLMETMVLRDLLDYRVSKAEKVNRVQLVLQASRVCLALQVQLVKLANQAKGVSLVNLVSLVLLVQEGSVAPQVKAVLLVLLVLLGAEVLLDPPGLMETRASLVCLVLQAPRVHLVLVDSQGRGVLPAYLEAREKRVKLVSEVKSETQAEMVLVGLRVL